MSRVDEHRNRDFVATMPLSNNRTPAGSITLEVWDQDTFKVGTPLSHGLA